MIEYYVDWYKFICASCGLEREFPVESSVWSIRVAVHIARALHDRENKRRERCPDPGFVNFIVVLGQKNDKIEVP